MLPSSTLLTVSYLQVYFRYENYALMIPSVPRHGWTQIRHCQRRQRHLLLRYSGLRMGFEVMAQGREQEDPAD